MLYSSLTDLQQQWADPSKRQTIIDRLAERGIDFTDLSDSMNQPDADPFDLLCHLAFDAPLRTRRERAERLRKDQHDFFDKYGPDARQILNELLDKYAVYGIDQLILPDVLQIPPISDRGNVGEIIRIFGDATRLRDAVTQLQTLLYAA